VARRDASGPVRPVLILREEWAHPRLAVHAYARDDVAASFVADRSARHWIKSEELSPALEPRDVLRTDDLDRLSSSGLIAISVTAVFSGHIEPASIGMIDLIRHEVTGEERRQPEYLRTF
jgi:hypothetical protein